jgi:hypothetical protein
VALGPTQLPIQLVPGAVSLGIKRPRGEAEVKNGGALTPLTPIYSRENFAFNVNFCEDYCLLGCDAVQSGRNLLTSGTNVLPCLQSRRVCHVNNQ